MTDDEIKHLMREQWPTAILVEADVQRIRNIVEAAIEATKEKAAKVCEENGCYDLDWNAAVNSCAEAIRSMK